MSLWIEGFSHIHAVTNLILQYITLNSILGPSTKPDTKIYFRPVIKNGAVNGSFEKEQFRCLKLLFHYVDDHTGGTANPVCILLQKPHLFSKTQ
jgi:hypothetical protein